MAADVAELEGDELVFYDQEVFDHEEVGVCAILQIFDPGFGFLEDLDCLADYLEDDGTVLGLSRLAFGALAYRGLTYRSLLWHRLVEHCQELRCSFY